jgi:hypothetical protein
MNEYGRKATTDITIDDEASRHRYIAPLYHTVPLDYDIEVSFYHKCDRLVFIGDPYDSDLIHIDGVSLLPHHALFVLDVLRKEEDRLRRLVSEQQTTD